ncbi:MAG: polysaccharide biosynthesis protein [Flavobacteriales bacterium]
MLKLTIPEKYASRWLVLVIDTFICLFSLAFAYLVRFDFISFPIEEEWPALKIALPIYVVVRVGLFILFKTHRGVVRHTSTQDSKRVFVSVLLGTVIFAILIPVRTSIDGLFFLPLSIVVIEFLLTLFLLLTFRFAIKLIFLEQKFKGKEKQHIIIYGAGEMGLITKRTIEQETTANYKVMAFVDDNPEKQGKSMEGSSIYAPAKLDELIKKYNVSQLIIAIVAPDPSKKRILIETALRNQIEVLTVPPVQVWMTGQLSVKQIKKVKIEDLLGRKPIELDNETLSKELKDKRVLVTGGAGSIGAEIVRQVLRFKPEQVYILDIAESALYDLENELVAMGYKDRFETVIGDVRNRHRMENVFKTFKPQYVFHAAAYKHVPLMEENPSEAILTNIGGSCIIADLAESSGSEKMVFVSTDKAVNPTSVMGASKRIAEIYIQTKSKKSKTKFITTRFGNVLGSNGSVIPLFKRQIDLGLPVTVTHPEVTRYFMTIPEACRLVLEAGVMGEGGEIFIFDMGESVKIADLARKMIHLSGLVPDKDVPIVFTGLRPGEKLYEELLATKENTIPTHHPQLMIAKVREYEAVDVNPKIANLVEMFDKQNNRELVTLMKEIVPEYISNNSEFETLDNKIKS